MTAVWIVLGVVAYVAGWIAFALAFDAFVWHPDDDDDECLGASLGLIWPFMLPLVLLIATIVGVGTVASALRKRIDAWRKRR